MHGLAWVVTFSNLQVEGNLYIYINPSNQYIHPPITNDILIENYKRFLRNWFYTYLTVSETMSWGIIFMGRWLKIFSSDINDGYNELQIYN